VAGAPVPISAYVGGCSESALLNLWEVKIANAKRTTDGWWLAQLPGVLIALTFVGRAQDANNTSGEARW
jgi:hypothetical protein